MKIKKDKFLKKNNLIHGAFILSLTLMIARIIGAFYRIPLNRLLSPQIIGLYSYSYPVFSVILSLSTAGFPTAIAKMISLESAHNNKKSILKIFKVSFIFLGIFSFINSFLLYKNADLIALKIIGIPETAIPIKAISPAIFFVTLMAIFRGFFQGMEYLLPYGLSEITEQIFKAIFAVFLGFTFAVYGNSYGAGGIAIGVTIGSIAGFLFIFISFLITLKRLTITLNNNATDIKVTYILKSLFKIAMPITIGGLIIPLMSSVDVTLVTRRMLLIPNITKETINELYAYFSSRAAILVNFPPVISLGLSLSLVPDITKSMVLNNFRNVHKNVTLSLSIILSIAIPSAFGYFVLADPIFTVLYGNNLGCYLLSILSISMIFLMLSQTLTGILNGLNKITLPVMNLCIGIIIKSIVAYFLLPIPEINIKALAYGSVSGYFITFLLNFLSVKKIINYPVNFSELAIIPLILSFIMAIIVKFSYLTFIQYLSIPISLIVSIIIGILIYFILSMKFNKNFKKIIFRIIKKSEKE